MKYARTVKEPDGTPGQGRDATNATAGEFCKGMLTGEPFKLIELRRTAGQRAKFSGPVYTAVSPEDFAALKEYRWALNISGIKRLYAFVNILDEKGKWKYMGMHRMVLKRAGIPIAEEEVVDHRNGYTLDNRRCNLRPASEALNRNNRYPFEVIHTNDPFPAPYAPATGPTLPPGAAYYFNREFGVWRICEMPADAKTPMGKVPTSANLPPSSR